MIIASIDIGSNTVLLLISEIDFQSKKIKTIKNIYRSPRISKDLTYGKPISEFRISMLVEVLNEYKRICTQYNVEKVLIVATNAFRIANNSEEIIKKVKNEIGFDIEIIDGDTEARLSFWGSIYSSINSHTQTVIDIGGGSTEIIYGDIKNIIYKNSFQIGVVSLTEKIFNNSIVSSNELRIAEEYSSKIFGSNQIPIPKGIDAISVAGTPTTLSCIKQKIKIYNEELVDGSQITFNELCNMIDEISQLNPEQIKDNYGQVVEGREDVLLAGSIILKVLMKKLALEKITVSSKGLRYGVIIDFMMNQN